MTVDEGRQQYADLKQYAALLEARVAEAEELAQVYRRRLNRCWSVLGSHEDPDSVFFATATELGRFLKETGA
jgi:hypothetical protein